MIGQVANPKKPEVAHQPLGVDDTVPGPRRTRILRGIAALPSMVTLGNGIAGFAAIHFATKPLPAALMDPAHSAAAGAWLTQNMVLAAWLVFVAMVFDALDGRLARMTRRTSDFGGQLDSLCDAISFGVAPAC